MFGTFFGLHVASSGLRAQQQALDIVSHNISNANTEGYKRQRAVMVEGNAVTGSFASGVTGFAAMGTGVRIESIERIHDSFIDKRVTLAGTLVGQWDMTRQALEQVEGIFSEPNDNGLQNELDQFWNAWQGLASLPENSANRIEVLTQAESLAERMRTAHQQLVDSRQQIDFLFQDKANSINLLTQQISDLNQQIASLGAAHYTPNELLNQRDMLVDKLAEIVEVQQFGEAGTDFMLTIGGRVLVNGTITAKVELGLTADGMSTLQWQQDGTAVDIGKGQLAGIVEARDNLIPGYLAQLDDIATTIINEVNVRHRTGIGLDGSTGLDFFVPGGTAGTIQLNPALKNNPNAVGASLSGASGDNVVAFDIAGLKNKAVVGTNSINQLYRTFIATIGANTQTAIRQADIHKVSLEQFMLQQQSVSGVSIDEEMTDMIRFQQAYNASARVITVMDEMLEQLITRTGVVGR